MTPTVALNEFDVELAHTGHGVHPTLELHSGIPFEPAAARPDRSRLPRSGRDG